MPLRLGQRFWSTQADMLSRAKNAQIFIKYHQYEFSFFDDLELYLEWFARYEVHCAKSKIPFAIYEILSTGKDMCFVCDIEVYCPMDISDSAFQKTQHALRKKFREVYGRYADANNVIFMEDHRPSSHRLKKSDTDKTPMMKMSFHALGLSELFNEMHTACEMKKLAKRVNADLVEGMEPEIKKHGIVLPGGNILDMGIYTKNRPMRTINSKKDVESKGLRLSECSKHMLIKNCFVTRVVCDADKTYYRLPEEFRVTHEESFKHVLERNAPTLHRKAEATHETLEAELDIKRYLQETFGDDVNVRYNGLCGNRNSFEVRGHRHCPMCKEEHVNNCAYINDRGGGNYSYKCMAAPEKRPHLFDMGKFKGLRGVDETKKDTPGHYLESFAHVRKKVISISGPMGCGKTHQIKNFLMQFPPGTRILFVTCRKGMARSTAGRFQGFVAYIDETNQELQVQEYESLHRINTHYDIVIMDEIRSMLTSAACFETNGLNITANMDKLRDLCADADHVICADADLHIDGCVKDFYRHVFDESDIHHINHTSGGQKLHHRFATDGAFVKMIQDDLRDGKKIMVCCGSSKELRGLREIALGIVPESKIGIYHADSEKQKELIDVYKHWPAYSFIGFTSTITVSIDYTGPIDRVYISPSFTTCGQRDMNQMKSRARNIVSNTVIVKYNPNADGVLAPLDVDLDALKNQEMNMVINRRRAMTTFRNAYDREFYGTIFKVGAGHTAKFFTSVLTDAWVWARVECYLKRKHWMSYFLTILEKKGYTWSCEVIGCEDADEHVEELKQKKDKVALASIDLLDRVDVHKMGKEEYKVLMMRKIRGTASGEDLAKIQKYQVQMHYSEKVNAKFVVEFNKKKRAIYNQTFLKRFPQEVRRKIHSNIMIMKDSLDTVNADTRLIPGFQRTLRLMGFQSTNDPDTRVDIKNMSEEASRSMEDVLELVKTVKMERPSRGNTPFSNFNLYLEKIMGYKLKYHRVRKKGETPSAYSLENTVPTNFLENKLYSTSWLQDHCISFDVHMKVPLGTEMEFMATHMGGTGGKRSAEEVPLMPNKRVKSFWGGM